MTSTQKASIFSCSERYSSSLPRRSLQTPVMNVLNSTGKTIYSDTNQRSYTSHALG